MLYDYVANQWNKGNISIGIPAATSSHETTPAVFIGRGLVKFALPLLSQEDKQKLISLSKLDAIRFKERKNKER